MDEKTMVNDILNSTKAKLTVYQNAISETENLGLRQTLIQIRNNEESFQYELYKVAKMKEYYKPYEESSTLEIQNVKNELQNL